ncbi:cation:dicarboxylate symporter family transporter, partial [Enterococcus faecalis]|uniref:cation:dicarboxylate symporter family transporter n=1 Tax=Enterococcus faecalis TaxID=1351 RepID=UPI003D6A6B53
GNGYVAFLQMLVILLVFVSMVGAFTKMKECNKLVKISFNVLATLLGTTAVAALVGSGTTLAFGLQGAKFTHGAGEKTRIDE